MKNSKYFKKQIKFTLSELIQIVEDNPSLCFYYPLKHVFANEEIVINNNNNGSRGRCSWNFKRVSDNEIIRLTE